jgi:hypothetical protein
LKKTSQADGKVARIGAERFFGATSAETQSLQVLQEAFPHVNSKAIQFAAYRSLMHSQKLGNLTKRALVEKVRAQQETISWRESLKRSMNRDLKFLRSCRLWSFGSRRRGRILRLQGRFSTRVPVVVDMALDKRSAKPAHQSASARIRLERRAALAIPFGKTK